jgi:hypothetical protein
LTNRIIQLGTAVGDLQIGNCDLFGSPHTARTSFSAGCAMRATVTVAIRRLPPKRPPFAHRGSCFGNGVFAMLEHKPRRWIMKRLLIGAFGLGVIAAAAAQQSNDLPPVQPPPEMESPASTPSTARPSAAPIVPLANSDEEARAAAAAEAKASAERAKALATPTLPASPINPEPGKPLDSPGLPPEVQRAAEATELPVVTVRQNGNERVEEYRKKGVLYFVRVMSQEGPTRYYVDKRTDVPPDINQLSAPSGHVEPVYYKLAEWK